MMLQMPGLGRSQIVQLLLLLLMLLETVSSRSQRTQYQMLNRKIDSLKSTLSYDIETLNFDVTDLRIDLDHVMANSGLIGNTTADGRGAGTRDAVGLQDKYTDLEMRLEELTTNFNDMKRENNQMKQTITQLSDQLDTDLDKNKHIRSLTDQIQELTHQIQSINADKDNARDMAIDEFITTIKHAFKSQKAHILSTVDELKKRVAEIETNVVEDANIDIGDDLIRRFDSVDEHMNSLREITDNIEQEIAQLKTKVDDQLENCCSGSDEDEDYSSVPEGVDPVVKPVPEGVTLVPGGPKILPIYGEDITKHINIGSRVVRGADWSWGTQDGNGPGTVDAFAYTMQVMVRWDSGQRANYRIGFHGKYDLYLLA